MTSGARARTRFWPLVVVVLTWGCGSEAARPTPDATDSDAAPAATCPVPDPTASSTALSFSDDVFPLLNRSCGTFACHNAAFRNRGLFLGESEDEKVPDSSSRAAAYETLLAFSETAPSLRRVEPGDPSRSFLMLKLDGCHASVGLECPLSAAERPCGDRMPPTAEQWPSESRETVRRWIAGGAPGP